MLVIPPLAVGAQLRFAYPAAKVVADVLEDLMWPIVPVDTLGFGRSDSVISFTLDIWSISLAGHYDDAAVTKDVAALLRHAGFA